MRSGISRVFIRLRRGALFLPVFLEIPDQSTKGPRPFGTPGFLCWGTSPPVCPYLQSVEPPQFVVVFPPLHFVVAAYLRRTFCGVCNYCRREPRGVAPITGGPQPPLVGRFNRGSGGKNRNFPPAVLPLLTSKGVRKIFEIFHLKSGTFLPFCRQRTGWLKGNVTFYVIFRVLFYSYVTLRPELLTLRIDFGIILA